MPIHIEFDSTCKILRGQITSQFDVAEYRKILKKITSGKDYPATIPTIWDLREMDFSSLEVELAYIVKQVREAFSIRDDAIIAYVVPSQLAYGLLRMLQAITTSEDMTLVSYDYHAAERWILEKISGHSSNGDSHT